MSKVLIIDDDPLLQKVYETILQSAGFETETCSDGIDGYHKIIATHPDIVLLDVMLPGLTGLEILDKLTTDIHPMPAVISITNLTAQHICNAALSKGARVCLIKDQLDPKDLIKEAKKIVGEATPPAVS